MSVQFARIYTMANNWLNRTEEVLREQLKKYDVGESDELMRSLKTEITTKTNMEIQMMLIMLRRGRFVDMGVGKGVPIERVKVARTRARGSKRKRKPKKWYSKAWFGRLRDLNGAIQYTVETIAIQTVKEQLDITIKI